MTINILTCPRCGTHVAAARAEGMRGICPKCLFEALVQPDAEPAARSPLELLEGQELGNYVVLGLVGSGGMGVVYRARQKGLERAVALKILNPTGLAQREDVERFFREARAAARLQHPNIVSIHEVANDRGYYFFTMDLVEGRTLADEIEAGKVSVERAMHLIGKVARAVHYAHETGIVHRDLKPANILIDPAGEPKVMDFGLAKDIGSSVRLTQTGTTMGTPSYMPPEQAEGRAVDARTDVYALGAVLYECLAGEPPFVGRTAAEIIRKVVSEEPPPIGPRVPRDLETICLKALQKDPGQRYASSRALAEDIERVARGEPILGRRPGLAFRVRRHLARQGAAAWVAAGFAAALLVAVVALAKHSPATVPPPSSTKKPSAEAQAKFNRLLDDAEKRIVNAHEVRDASLRPKRIEWLREAHALLDEAAKLDKSGARLFALRGRAFEEMGDVKSAGDAYTRALLKDPKDVQTRYRRSWVFFVTVWRHNLKLGLSPDRYCARTLRDDAEILRRQKAPAEAVAVVEGLDRCLTTAIAFLTAHGPTADADRAKAVDEGKPILEKLAARALDENPRCAQAHFLRTFPRLLEAVIPARHDTALEEGIAAVTSALEAEPNNVDFLITRASLLWEAGRRDESERDSDAVGEIAPNLDDALIGRAFIHVQSGSTDAFDEDIRRALEVTSDPARVHAMAGYALSKSGAEGAYPKAMEHFDSALEAHKDYLPVYLMRGLFKLRSQRDVEGGRSDLETFVELDPANPFAAVPMEALKGRVGVVNAGSAVAVLKAIAQCEDDAKALGRLHIDVQQSQNVSEEDRRKFEQDIFVKIATANAAAGEVDRSVQYVVRLADMGWQGWAGLEANPAFHGVMQTPMYLELKARAAADAESLERTARSLVESARQRIENAAKLTAPGDRARRHEWLDAAIDELAQAASVAPNSADALRWLGRAFDERQQWDAAVGAYTEALRLDPGQCEVRYRRFLTSFALVQRRVRTTIGGTDAAASARMKEDLEGLRRLKAPADWIEVSQGLLALSDAAGLDREKMKDHVDEALRANPANAYATLLRAFAPGVRGVEAEELSALKRAAELEPNSLMLRLCCVDGLQKYGRAEEALAQIEEAMQIAPESEVPYLLRAKSHVAAGRNDEAWEDLNTALELAPEPAYVHVFRANVVLTGAAAGVRGRPEKVSDEVFAKAKAELDAALLLNPDEPLGLLVRGQLLVTPDRDPEAGRADLRRFIEKNPDHPMRRLAEAWMK